MGSRSDVRGKNVAQALDEVRDVQPLRPEESSDCNGPFRVYELLVGLGTDVVVTSVVDLEGWPLVVADETTSSTA